VPACDPVDSGSLVVVRPPSLTGLPPTTVPIARLTVRLAREYLLDARRHTAAAPSVWLPLLGDQEGIRDWTAVWVWAASAKDRTRYQCDLIWKMLRNALPTGQRFQWTGDGRCPYGCETLETTPHIFFQCEVARRAWASLLDDFARKTGVRLALYAPLGGLGPDPDRDAQDEAESMVYVACVHTARHLGCPLPSAVRDNALRPSFCRSSRPECPGGLHPQVRAVL
jgi:hypothetical protein